jgi:hypothetical protein
MKHYYISAETEFDHSPLIFLLSDSREKLIKWLEENRPDAVEVSETQWCDSKRGIWFMIPLDGIQTI